MPRSRLAPRSALAARAEPGESVGSRSDPVEADVAVRGDDASSRVLDRTRPCRSTADGRIREHEVRLFRDGLDGRWWRLARAGGVGAATRVGRAGNGSRKFGGILRGSHGLCPF